MEEALLDKVADLNLCDEDPECPVVPTGIRLEELPKEIISQILREAIPPWSLRIDRHIRHGCRPHNFAMNNRANSEEDTKPETSLAYIARPTAPHDIRYLLRISKLIYSLVRAEYLHTYTGILEVYRFTIQGEGRGLNMRLESSLTESGCPCFSDEERVDKLRAALGIYVPCVRAIRLMESSPRALDLNLLQILPMAKIAFIDRSSDLTILKYNSPSMLNGLSIDRSSYDLLDSITDSELLEMSRNRWLAYSQRPGSPIHTIWGSVSGELGRKQYTSKLWTGPVITLVEARIRPETRPAVWEIPKEYAYVGFAAKNGDRFKPDFYLLGKFTDDEGDDAGENFRLASYLDALRKIA